MAGTLIKRIVPFGAAVVILVTGMLASGPVFADEPVDDTSMLLEQYQAQLDEQSAKADDPAPGSHGEAPGQESPEPENRSLEGSPQALAAAAGFNPGTIISDYNFYNAWAMGEGDVQAFLNGEVPRCLPGYTCLKDYRQTTWTRSADAMCSQYTGEANESAARIIYKVGLACGISQKVLLVLLEKEQSLVTDDWPGDNQYRKATGYACPDTAPCDAEFAGFYNQVYKAAWQYKRYANPPGTSQTYTWYPVGATTAVRYHPEPSCGTSPVFISNTATAALYYYTPYQPNAAALSNLYGTGDACSTYGNRNFWRLYRDWFGDPASSATASRIAGPDRFATAAALSQSVYPASGVPVVYVTSAENFPDSLSAAPAAVAQGGPLLLVTRTALPGATDGELRRLAPRKIVVIGGTSAIGDSVFASLRDRQSNIVRIAGTDRFDTSRQIARYAFGSARPPRAYVASGVNFPDALSASAAAGAQRIPVVLVDGGSSYDPDAIQLVADLGVSRVTIAGGGDAVSATMQNTFTNAGFAITRLGGIDRYRTSVEINRNAFTTADTFYFASGTTFPDAMAGAAAAGKAGKPLYVTPPGCVFDEVRSDIGTRGVSSLKLIGGPASLTDNVAALVRC
ncbi:cell wall-binding repeat-containing protein [Compostimonas suwonensis]|uniref:Putative cell wall binding repeat protein n=1 Tax=Compostimonas suwonensis TaxID=1048394 RepID=A0A2M9BUW7_9MICO|nr:cell wall-binding repeat-containing protein [Compostimonas suwonensis]PJJ61746.1 putative cell wall binding repeat protein [Compostimonas suwonensis]